MGKGIWTYPCGSRYLVIRSFTGVRIVNNKSVPGEVINSAVVPFANIAGEGICLATLRFWVRVWGRVACGDAFEASKSEPESRDSRLLRHPSNGQAKDWAVLPYRTKLSYASNLQPLHSTLIISVSIYIHKISYTQ
jgi:hypothetical protein